MTDIDLNMTSKEYAIQCFKDEAEAVLGLIPQLDGSFDEAVKLMFECKGKVIVTGVGKSGHIGAKIAATLSSTRVITFHPHGAPYGYTHYRHERQSGVLIGKILYVSLERECEERSLSAEPGSHQFYNGPVGNGRCLGCRTH